MASNCKIQVNDKNIRSYSQDLRKWSAELINHPITHQRLIDSGFKYYISMGNIILYVKNNFGIHYDSEYGFWYVDSKVKTICITHESQLRHLYLMFTGFELNKL